jgi:hypothetical protein
MAQIIAHRYNVITKSRQGEIIDTDELVSIRTAHEIRNEARKLGQIANIIEDWTVDCNFQEVYPKSNDSKPAIAPRKAAMNTPQISEKKDRLVTAQKRAKAIDKLSRNRKNIKCTSHMYRIIKRVKGNRFPVVDMQGSEKRIVEYLTGRTDGKEFQIIYLGIAESWGKEV